MGWNQGQLDRYGNSLSATFDPQLFINMIQVLLHGPHRNMQLSSDLWIGQAFAHQLQDFISRLVKGSTNCADEGVACGCSTVLVTSQAFKSLRI